MLTRRHALPEPATGTRRELISLHFGEPGHGGKAYLQASLHADEIPGMLVIHHLRPLLEQAERQGRLRGEVVLVPVANPIGLSQWLMHDFLGRFEFNSGENFNRHYPDLLDAVSQRVEGRLGDDADANTALIREALRAEVAALPAVTELAGLRKTLLGLAVDADIVLDLHCDFQAAAHLYTETPYWEQAEPLARLLGTAANLLARGSGGASFDEACSQPWWQLAERWGGRHPIPLACLSCTVELRGEADVGHDLARRDARAIYDFLVLRGLIDDAQPTLPALLRPATPLAGSANLIAERPGVVVFLAEPGDWIEAGATVAELVDPFTAEVTPVTSPVSGVLYARENRRYAHRGLNLGKVAGATPFRSGNLLGA